VAPGVDFSLFLICGECCCISFERDVEIGRIYEDVLGQNVVEYTCPHCEQYTDSHIFI